LNPGYLRQLRDRLQSFDRERPLERLGERALVLESLIELCDQVQQIEERL